MRAALPQGSGDFPAFWLLPASVANPLDRELDVMEQVGDGSTHSAAHYALDGAKAHTGFANYMGDTSGFHTYGMLWTATQIAWYVDGVEVSSMATPADLNQPMYLLVNLGVGGAWAGAPDANMAPQTMKVDYIRAYSVDPDATAATINARAPHIDSGSTITGTNEDNHLAGSSSNDAIHGLGGDDTLHGGGGNDVLDGGAGPDTADYSGALSGVHVDLSATGAQDTGGAGVDTLVSIANLSGSGHDDTLTGNNQANTLSGQAGNDILFGAGGDDNLAGGAGNDVLNGGAGNDVIDGGAGNGYG